MLALTAFQVPHEFVAVPAGTYWVGKGDHIQNPRRKVALNSFAISRYDVTNEQFASFVKATGYRTDAERTHNAMVFEPPLEEFRWIHDSTAYWRFPNGVAREGIDGRWKHPVTCISFHDAEEYCRWAGVRLPTLDEWEVAARARTDTDFFFGACSANIGQYANVWHTRTHLVADRSDGYMYTSPVGAFKPNPLGLYDIYGNVFQFCTGRIPGDRNPRTVHARGGSWWCSKNACCFFNSVDIGSVDIHASFSNQGFRAVAQK